MLICLSTAIENWVMSYLSSILNKLASQLQL